MFQHVWKRSLSRAERIEGGLIGLLVGDALGVPYEFHAPQHLPPLAEIEMQPPTGFHRAHQGVPIGTWSDDGAQALCLLASLLTQAQMDLDDLGRRFVNWMIHGYLAVDADVFDIGITTSYALKRLEQGVPAARAGAMDENANGNGALMRVLPLALWHVGSDAELIRDAMLQSKVTHGHELSQVCCAVYCLWARRILDEAEPSWNQLLLQVEPHLQANPAAQRELENIRNQAQHWQPRGTGYVLDSLLSTRHVMQQPDYESVVKAAIALGHDTDTTACIAGGLAGVRDGIGAIPQRWRAVLRGQDLLLPIKEALLAHRGG